MAPITKVEEEPGFPKFSELAPELREKIWNFAMPEARIVKLETSKRTIPAFPFLLIGDGPAITTRRDVPDVFHATKESRELGLKAYGPRWEQYLNEKPVFFNYEKDILFGDNELTTAKFCAKVTHPIKAGLSLDKTEIEEKLRFLAIGPSTTWTTNFVEILGRFVNLDTLFLEDTEGKSDEHIERVNKRKEDLVKRWETELVQKYGETEGPAKVPKIVHLNRKDFESCLSAY